MRKLLSLIILLSALSAGARTAADFLLSAPYSGVPAIAERARLEMLEYFKGGSEARVKNVFGGSSKVAVNTPEYVTVDVSDKTQITVAVVPARRDTMIAVIETVLTPVPDSRVTFYSTDWKELAQQPGELTVADFVDRAALKADPEAEMPEFPFYTLTYMPDDNTFMAANTTPKYYAKVDRPSGLRAMKSAIRVRFDGKKWKIIDK